MVSPRACQRRRAPRVVYMSTALQRNNAQMLVADGLTQEADEHGYGLPRGPV